MRLVPSARPSMELVRSLSDEHVLRALMEEPRLTRADLATRTGLSKPTAAESVRRLNEAGLVFDTGERTTGRGRVGTYYALSDGIGCAIVISIAPEGIIAETVDARGTRTSRVEGNVRRPVVQAQVTKSLIRAATRAVESVRAPVRIAVVSAADPVDRETGRLVQLPDAPFLLGELSPAAAIAHLVEGPVVVDNDVNWAARAERLAVGPDLDDFAYLFLGEGLGCAIVSDGEVRRGSSGIAGEVAHLITAGPRGYATTFTDVFSELGLRHPGTAAINMDAMQRVLNEQNAHARRQREMIARGVCGVLAALIALTDPNLVVIGGPWGPHPSIMKAILAELDRYPRKALIRPAHVTEEPSLSGARSQAVLDLQAYIIGLVGDPGRAPRSIA
jgi:predicted NBD/HSP70 family sugar kinase